MCGIAGIHHYAERRRPVDAAILDAMTASLAHRGPDGDGTFVAPGIGLGHRRLAILDVSEAGKQPMADAEGEIVVTYNGEIYNYRELRRELTALGHRFHRETDTEVLLVAYRQWGVELLSRLSGIFAFALWDARKRRLFLARDPLGVKPLFYADDGRTLRFGSEIKAILTDPGVDRGMDLAALDGFLTFSYTPAPATGFAAVRQLLPGRYALVDEGGMTLHRHYEVPYSARARSSSFAQAVAEFTERLDRITKAQMVSDVPVGAFLSGGLDSAAVVRAMKRADKAEVHTLTVGFDAAGFDERVAARSTARELGVSFELEEMKIDAASLLPKLSLHMEEPTADSSMLPVYLLCRDARRRFTVAMSGDGADEILAGYDTYRATALAAHYRRAPAFLRRRVIEPLARRIPIRDGKYGLNQVATRFTRGAALGPGRDHASWRVAFHDELKQRLYAPEFLQRTRTLDPIGDYAGHTYEVPAGREPLAGLLHADTSFYLPNDMLVKVDRMSMAHGLEVRVPFLDVEMVRFAADLPPEHKLWRGKVRKHVLRESLRGSISDRTLDAPKSGFNVPLEAWMRGPLRELLLDTVSARRAELGAILSPAEVERVADEHRARRADHAHALFAVLMLGLWMENARSAWRGAAAA